MPIYFKMSSEISSLNDLNALECAYNKENSIASIMYIDIKIGDH